MSVSPASQAARAAAPWRSALPPLLEALARTAVARDQAGGTAKHERDLLRHSRLLGMSIPPELGGEGASWQAVLDATRQLAQVDSSLAHLFAFHHLLLATAQLFGLPQQWEPWLRQTVQRRWFWGNALNPLDHNTQAIIDQTQGGYRFHGLKSFCSGAVDSDMLVASAFDHDGKLLIGVIPTAREGIDVLADWDNIGQRQTDSGSVRFQQVHIAKSELLAEPGPLSTPYASLRPLLAQLVLAHIYLGLGEGALAQARQFTLQQSRPWAASNAASASEDPYVLAHYGDFWLALEGARALVERAAEGFDQAWSQGPTLTAQTRGELAIAVAAAKVSSARAGLDVAHRLFEVTGARATSAALRLDRYWRNLRVHTLHDPIDYKRRELGDWVLNQRPPHPSFYS